MSQVLTAKDSIIARVPPTYQYSVLNGWGTNEQDDEEVPVLDLDHLNYFDYLEVPVLDIRAGDEWSTGSRESSDVDMIGANDDPPTLDMLSMENENGPLVPGLGDMRRVSLPGDGMGGPAGEQIASDHQVDFDFAGPLSFVNGRVNSSILDDSDEVLPHHYEETFSHLQIFHFRTSFNLDKATSNTNSKNTPPVL